MYFQKFVPIEYTRVEESVTYFEIYVCIDDVQLFDLRLIILKSF